MNRKTILKATAAVGALVIITTGVGYAAQHSFKHRFLSQIDTNADRQLSRSEVDQFAGKKFDQYDSNKDGKISSAEIDAALSERIKRIRVRILDRFDNDEDGEITKAEVSSRAGKLFAVVDVNDDGSLSASELRKARRMWRGHRHELRHGHKMK